VAQREPQERPLYRIEAAGRLKIVRGGKFPALSGIGWSEAQRCKGEFRAGGPGNSGVNDAVIRWAGGGGVAGVSWNRRVSREARGSVLNNRGGTTGASGKAAVPDRGSRVSQNHSRGFPNLSGVLGEGSGSSKGVCGSSKPRSTDLLCITLTFFKLIQISIQLA
jgi:hypothetical protein